MLALGLCQPHYQNLLKIIEIYSKECKGCKERIKLNQYAILLDLKIINYVINATNVKKDS